MDIKILEDKDTREKIKGLARSLVNSYLLTEAVKHDLVISLYGANEVILDCVSKEMKEYLNEMKNNHIKIIRGDRDDPYSVDIGYFIHGGKLAGV